MSEKTPDKNVSGDIEERSVEKPSTSSGTSGENDEEMQLLLQKTDEMLEDKAKSMNLTSLNVRSILHHLIKYPSTIDVLLGIAESDDVPTVRNTRSRKRPGDSTCPSTSVTPKKFALRIEDKAPKNWMEFQYDENDEQDEDYVEARVEGEEEEEGTGTEEESSDDEENEDEDEDEEEEDETLEELEQLEGVRSTETENQRISDERIASRGVMNNVEALERLLQEEEDPETMEDPMMNEMILSRPQSIVPTLDNMDCDYQDFIHLVQCPEEDFSKMKSDTDDDENDEDYDLISDNLNVEDWDETRQDKTTLIPRHELKGLYMDTLLAEKEIPINALMFPEPVPVPDKPRKEKPFKVPAPLKPPAAASSDTVAAFSSDGSCLLSSENVTIRPEELSLLRQQLTQHVQLLTQFVVSCFHDEMLREVHDEAQLMLNELDDRRNREPDESLFNVPNLSAAMDACHSINSFPPVDPALLVPLRNVGNGVPKPITHRLRPEAVVVLAESDAIRFPALLPPVPPRFSRQPIDFLPSEDFMLAVALLKFQNCPVRQKGYDGKYKMIQQYALPARSITAIRNRLKLCRRGRNASSTALAASKMHTIIADAEKGVCTFTMAKTRYVEHNGPVTTWPRDDQPKWLPKFLKHFVVTDNHKIFRRGATPIVVTPTKKKAASSICVMDNLQDPQANEATTTAEGSEETADADMVKLGLGQSGQQVLVSRNDVGGLIKQLQKAKQVLPTSKRRKNPAPMRIAPSIFVARDNVRPSTSQQMSTFVPPESSDSLSFPIPMTPGRRSPDEHDYLDLESHSLSCGIRASSVTMGNPPTPRVFRTDEPTDFSALISASEVEICAGAGWQPPIGSGRCGSGQYSNSSTESTSSTTKQPPRPDSARAPATDVPNAGDAAAAAEDDSTTSVLGMVPEGEGEWPDYHDEPEEREPRKEEKEEKEEEEVVEPVNNKESMIIRGHRLSFRPILRNKKPWWSDDPNQKPSRKRMRVERERTGLIGLENDQFLREQQAAVARKVVDDIRKRLFMYKPVYQSFVEVMTDPTLSETEKVTKIVDILGPEHPELLALSLLYAPLAAIPANIYNEEYFQSHRAAVEMILDIERYVTGAAIKEPTLRNIFKSMIDWKNENPAMTSDEATRKFFTLLAQEKPLWARLEKHFGSMPYRGTPTLEQFESIDLTQVKGGTRRAMLKRAQRERTNRLRHFEKVLSIDDVSTRKCKSPHNSNQLRLVVKCGEFCIRNVVDDSHIQLEIVEKQWSRDDDILLLTRYNEHIHNTPGFTADDIASVVPEVPFGPKSTSARLKYLFEELARARNNEQHQLNAAQNAISKEAKASEASETNV